MKAKHILTAAVIAAVTPFVAHAETPLAIQFDDPASRLKRAEVRAEVLAARAVAANDIDPFGPVMLASTRSAAEVRAEARLVRHVAGDILVADVDSH